MEGNFLTPIQLWQDFNPVKDPLELAVIETAAVEDGVTVRKIYYTSETAGDGKVRVYSVIYFAKDPAAPLLIYVPDIDLGVNDKMLCELARRGYTVAACDLSGRSFGRENHTVYPDSYHYCNYGEAKTSLCQATPSAKESCWFVWAKAVRRLITVVESFNRGGRPIGIVGERRGACVMWQVAAMDGRLKAAVSLLGDSIVLPSRCKYEPAIPEKELNDNAERFMAAVSPMAYFRFVTCPALMLVASNSRRMDFDRISDRLALLPGSAQGMLSASMTLSEQITEGALSTLYTWLDIKLRGAAAQLVSPEIFYEVQGGELYFKVSIQEKAEEVSLYHAEGELNPACRDWTREVMTATCEGEYSAKVRVADISLRKFAIAEVRYKNGATISSRLISLIPADSGAKASASANKRIIFDSTVNASFGAETEGLALSSAILAFRKCPKGIRGISVSEGKLFTYHISAASAENENILQLSAFSATPKRVVVTLTRIEGGTEQRYSAAAGLFGEGLWQKVSFNAQDFKTAELIPLKDWQNLKKIEFIGAENVLFNNIIWV